MLCPVAETAGLMTVIVAFHAAAQKAIAEFSGGHKIGWNKTNNSMKDTIKKITDTKITHPIFE